MDKMKLYLNLFLIDRIGVHHKYLRRECCAATAGLHQCGSSGVRNCAKYSQNRRHCKYCVFILLGRGVTCFCITK